MEIKQSPSASEQAYPGSQGGLTSYQPIENYGIIGDLHSAALVGMDGSIDWMCLPRFDSPSVFAAILDDEKGGRFKIATVSEGVTRKQLYWPDTNVLITRFFTPEGVGEITDYMPVDVPTNGHRRSQVIRRVEVVRGEMTFRMECSPAFNYARDEHEAEIVSGGATFRSEQLGLGLATGIPLKQQGGGVVSEFSLQEDQIAVFALRDIEGGEDRWATLSEQGENELFMRTVGYWRRWLSKSTYTGRWREMVHRSALTLKLLTFEPTGAIVAAPTTSLPESIGGERNWDYRYTWIRDAAFTLYGLLRIGFAEEAEQFMGWLEDRCYEPKPDGLLQLMYGIDGRTEPDGGDPGSPGGLPGFAPGPDRERRLRPTAARHLWRVDGRGLPLQQVRRPHLVRAVDSPARSNQLGLRQLAARGRGDMGGSKRSTAFCVLEANVLGRRG
jgi:GH15 family glucan-1,4-alpha-glucosidase